MALAHEPIGKPGGGVWGMKGRQYPAYFQHIRNDLMEQGHGETEAHSLAWGILRNFAEGHDGKGNRVSPEVQAKAVAALAEMKKLQAEAKATRSTPMPDYDGDGLDASWDGDHSDLPDLTGLGPADFPGEEPPAARAGSMALGGGGRFARLKAALAAKGFSDPAAGAAKIGQNKWGKAKFQALAAAARKRKDKGGPASRSEIMRFYSVDDIHVLTRGEGDGSGRVVEAYAAVFGDPVAIRDHQGEYEEEIDRHAFDDALAAHARRRGGIASAVRVLYNHGRTMGGSEAAAFQTPLGRPLEVIPDSRGLLTRTEYARTPHAEEILELIRAGAITAQSFVGQIMRSSPELRGPGDAYRRRGGTLTRVRRLGLGLREYGPVLYAAYPGAEVLGVRMGAPGSYEDVTATDGGTDSPEFEETVPAEEEDGAGGVPEDTTSTRYHARRLWQLRNQEMRREAGIVPLRRDSA